MKVFNYSLIFSFTLLAFISRLTEGSSAMKRLYEDLFTDYNKLILPVGNNRTKVVVDLGLKLGQILDLNLKQQILSTNVWVEQTWHDYKLEWNPELYDGIDMIHVPAENIWIPDIVLFNNADGNYELTLVAKANVHSNGTVSWKPPTMFRSTCEIDVEYFPFDIQTCFLRFGSWTYAGDEVELRHVGTKARKVEIGIDLSQFYKNVEWDIIDVPAYYNENHYDCCSEPFPYITFKIVIRRKMLFYLVNLILPVALMTFMTVSVFYLPSDSNEKVTLSISILTSLIVFFLLMLEIIPASSLAVPLFGKYLLFTLVLVSLSACVSVYVLNIHHRSPAVHSMSPTVRRIFLKTLPRLLRLNRPDPRERSSLNRFRKKKIAQQMLEASAANKVYDLAQPLATSLNLIETLHKSYNLNDKVPSAKEEDDEGRFFRRYVDNYIDQLKKQRASCKCNNPAVATAAGRTLIGKSQLRNRTTLTPSCCGGTNNFDWTESSARCPLVTPSGRMQDDCNMHNANCNPKGNRLTTYQLGMLNDDTLDMTFDYDDQENGFASNSGRFSQQQQQHLDDLPSPPPPPRPLTQLNDGRLSSCSKNNVTNLRSSQEASAEDERLVDKLISSINFISNNNSDEIDTTTTTTTNDLEESAVPITRGDSRLSQACTCKLHCQVQQPPPPQQQQQQQQQLPINSTATLRKPSDLLLSLRLSYDQMPAHVRAAIRSILFIADTIKNEDDENSAIEDWESMSMVVDRLFLCIFFLLCTFGSIIILALAPSLYDQRASIDDKLRIDIPPSNCSAAVFAPL